MLRGVPIPAEDRDDTLRRRARFENIVPQLDRHVGAARTFCFLPRPLRMRRGIVVVAPQRTSTLAAVSARDTCQGMQVWSVRICR